MSSQVCLSYPFQYEKIFRHEELGILSPPFFSAFVDISVFLKQCLHVSLILHSLTLLSSLLASFIKPTAHSGPQPFLRAIFVYVYMLIWMGSTPLPTAAGGGHTLTCNTIPWTQRAGLGINPPSKLDPLVTSQECGKERAIAFKIVSQ